MCTVIHLTGKANVTWYMLLKAGEYALMTTVQTADILQLTTPSHPGMIVP